MSVSATRAVLGRARRRPSPHWLTASRRKFTSNRGKENSGGKKTTAYVALGSNLGNRVHNLEAGLRAIRSEVGRIERTSLLYETVPMYIEEQPRYLNAAVSSARKRGREEERKRGREEERKRGREEEKRREEKRREERSKLHGAPLSRYSPTIHRSASPPSSLHSSSHSLSSLSRPRSGARAASARSATARGCSIWIFCTLGTRSCNRGAYLGETVLRRTRR